MYYNLMQHYVQRPSKYNKIQKFLPQILLDKPPMCVKKVDDDIFNLPRYSNVIYENKFRIKK
jgi:hypothetical protein